MSTHYKWIAYLHLEDADIVNSLYRHRIIPDFTGSFFIHGKNLCQEVSNGAVTSTISMDWIYKLTIYIVLLVPESFFFLAQGN